MKLQKLEENHILYGAFCAIIAVGITAAFYRSPFRARVDDFLFDLRAQMGGQESEPTAVAVAAISEATIKAATGGLANDLTYATLAPLVQRILAAKPRAVLVNLYPQIFPYSDPGLEPFVQQMRGQPVHFGLFGITDFSSGSASLPTPLRTGGNHSERIFLADTLPEFRRAVVRYLPVEPRTEQDSPKLLMSYAAHTFLKENVDQLDRDAGLVNHRDEIDYSFVRLNYRALKTLRTVTLDGPTPTLQDTGNFAGRVVILGYSAFRPWGTQSSHMNTPWQADGEDLALGVPLVQIQAVGVANILEKSWLHPVSIFVNVLQTIVITILSILVWRLRSALAATLFVCMWGGLIFAHAFIMEGLNLWIPLADTALFSAFGLVTGSILRVRMEGRMRASREAQTESNRAVAHLQSQYLDDLAKELGAINARVAKHLAPVRVSQNANVQKAFGQALAASEELREYLVGIEQLAELDAKALTKVVKRPVRLQPTLERISRRFDFRMKEDQISLTIDCPPTLKAMADETLLEQVLYNLLSNAVKYSNRGSAVVMRARLDGSRCIVEVEDQGPGIAPEFVEKIFEKFYRIRDDRLYKVRGHGLGLYLSRFFAESMGAHIGVRSAAGVGATFTLSLIGAK